jgi:energy-coupling factor transporter ATP-binding protein EcfA2
MNIRKLRLEHVGPIRKAEIEFGDLTVLVGPQASGKSIFLQFLKLLVDNGSICDTLQRHGLDWSSPREFLEVYLGEGMGALWKPREIKLVVDGKRRLLKDLTDIEQKRAPESLFYIPAQRVLTLSQGWPRAFDLYETDAPFVVREFSERLRLSMAHMKHGREIFPRYQRIKSSGVRDRLQHEIFAGFRLEVDKQQGQKRLVLQSASSKESLPFMVWSAGQREFVPLLLGFFWLFPPSLEDRRRDALKWVVIEEPEMGLHPRAIAIVLLLVLELLARGYRVCVSTHSPQVLELVWALGIVQKRAAKPERLLELFDVEATPSLRQVAKAAVGKRAKVYFFDRETGLSRDISSLDPGASDAVVAEWGGLSEFAGRAGEVVSRVVNETE